MTKLRLLHLALAVGVVVVVVLRAHPSELRSALADADFGLAAIAVLLNVPIALLAALRSSFVFRRLGHRVPAAILIPTTILGFVAVVCATTNIVGGFLITDRMLKMFKRDDKKVAVTKT